MSEKNEASLHLEAIPSPRCCQCLPFCEATLSAAISEFLQGDHSGDLVKIPVTRQSRPTAGLVARSLAGSCWLAGDLHLPWVISLAQAEAMATEES